MASTSIPLRQRCTSPGFTLIELLVALAVLGIVVALAAPSFAAALQRQREASAAQELIAALELGRAEAIRTGRAVVVRRVEPCAASQAAGHWRCGWQMFVDIDADNLPDANEPVVLHGGAHSSVWLHRAGSASTGPFIQISRFGSLPLALKVLAHAPQVHPDSDALGTRVCTWGTRLRLVHGNGCGDDE